MTIHEGHLLKVHLNPNVSGLKPSATVAINDLSNELRQRGKEVYKLGLGQSPFPVPKPVVEALQRNAHQKDYLPVKGLRELQEAVAEHHCRTFGIRGRSGRCPYWPRIQRTHVPSAIDLLWRLGHSYP